MIVTESFALAEIPGGRVGKCSDMENGHVREASIVNNLKQNKSS